MRSKVITSRRLYTQANQKNKGQLRRIFKTRDIILMDLQREDRRHDEELRQEAEKQKIKINVQYMAITIAIGVVFILC